MKLHRGRRHYAVIWVSRCIHTARELMSTLLLQSYEAVQGAKTLRRYLDKSLYLFVF